MALRSSRSRNRAPAATRVWTLRIHFLSRRPYEHAFTSSTVTRAKHLAEKRMSELINDPVHGVGVTMAELRSIPTPGILGSPRDVWETDPAEDWGAQQGPISVRWHRK